MKTRIRPWIAVLLGGLLLLLLTACASEQAPQYTGEFSIADYEEYVANENFHTSLTYGPIDDFETAAEVGRQAMLDKFGENCFDNERFSRAWSVQYDESADVWRILTYFTSKNIDGGGYDVLIKSDGTVVAIWAYD